MDAAMVVHKWQLHISLLSSPPFSGSFFPPSPRPGMKGDTGTSSCPRRTNRAREEEFSPNQTIPLGFSQLKNSKFPKLLSPAKKQLKHFWVHGVPSPKSPSPGDQTSPNHQGLSPPNIFSNPPQIFNPNNQESRRTPQAGALPKITSHFKKN